MVPAMSTILVVDDEPHIREVVGSYLVREGHEVRYAGDGDADCAARLVGGRGVRGHGFAT